GRGSRARLHHPVLLAEKILQRAKALARAPAAESGQRASCGRSASRAADSCRPAWWGTACGRLSLGKQLEELVAQPAVAGVGVEALVPVHAYVGGRNRDRRRQRF